MYNNFIQQSIYFLEKQFETIFKPSSTRFYLYKYNYF